MKEIIMITRIKKTLTAIPASIAEASRFLVAMGEKQREINRINADLKEKVVELEADAKKKLEPLTISRDSLFIALFAFASPRKDELTVVTRSTKTSTGIFGWRWTTPFVRIEEGANEVQIIELLKSMGLGEYVRVIEEIDREALLREKPFVPGVSYLRRDEFFAKPKLAKGEGGSKEFSKEERTVAIDI